jgi:CMP-N-acetylneuraminic acid synthetase
VITFKEWCLMQSQILNNTSDLYNKAHKRFMSTVCAGEANAYKQIAESEWAKRYDSFKAKNNRLREALQALYDEQNGPPLENDKEDWQEAMRMAEEALREGE